MFTVDGYYLDTEEDIFEDGCQPDSGINCKIDDPLESDTIDGLIELICRQHGEPRQALTLQSCEELNRIDLSYPVDNDNVRATPKEIEDWKQGKRRLWLANCSYYVYEKLPVTLPLK